MSDWNAVGFGVLLGLAIRSLGWKSPRPTDLKGWWARKQRDLRFLNKSFTQRMRDLVRVSNSRRCP